LFRDLNYSKRRKPGNQSTAAAILSLASQHKKVK